MITIKTNSSQNTINLGRQFSKALKAKDVIILEGALGGGKTTFVKGLLNGLGLRAKVLSPSFTLLRQYHRKNLYIYHVDLYRIDKRNIFSLGIEDYLYAPKSITIIEWGEKIENFLPRYIKIEFSFLKEDSRKIIFSLKGYKRNINIGNLKL